MVAHIAFKLYTSRNELDITTSRVTITDRRTLVVGTIGSREFNEWDLSEIDHAWIEEE